MLWSRDQRKEEEKGSPGPGHYKPLNEPETAGTESAAYSFTHAATGREVITQCLQRHLACCSCILTVSYPGQTLPDCISALADGIQHTPDSSELVCDVAVEDMT